jgi:hypothetical protein
MQAIIAHISLAYGRQHAPRRAVWALRIPIVPGRAWYTVSTAMHPYGAAHATGRSETTLVRTFMDKKTNCPNRT